MDREPLIQGSAFTLVCGPKGVGKGTWTALIAGKMTQGTYGEPCNVLWVASEDSFAIDVVPRLITAGADLDRVHLVDEHVVLPKDIDRLRAQAQFVGGVGLIVVDPLGNHLGGADTDKEGAVWHGIGALNQLADELGCAIFGIRHLKKDRQNGALASVLGSTAWIDVPRCVLAFAPDNDDEAVFHVQVVAGNRSGSGAGESYRIELRDIGGASEPVTRAAELGVSSKDVDELLSAAKRTSKSKVARDLILDILENDGEQESDTLDARVASETGLAAKTVKNQRVALKNEGLVRNVPVKDEHGEITLWKVARTGAPRE